MMPSISPLSSSEDTLRNITPNALTLASEEATVEWKNDFLALFHDAKNRFPDDVWRTPDGKEAVWGHKAIVYERDKGPILASAVVTNAPNPNRAFSFSFRPTHPPTRNFDLLKAGVHRTGLDEPHPPHKRLPKPSLKRANEGEKITILEAISSQAELSDEVLALYSVDVGPPNVGPIRFPRLTDSDSDPIATSQDTRKSKDLQDDQYGNKLKLLRSELMVSLYRENLVKVWKDRLYTDIQISVPWFGQEAIKHRENSVFRFSGHRSILVSRSPVLRNVLMGKTEQNSLITLKTDATTDMVRMALPYPPFTPSSFYYILGYMYTGTIHFRPNREISLNTAFSIVRSSIFLGMPTLQKLVVAQIVVKMVHGLFHAYLSNSEYVRLVGGSWSKMEGKCGCHCMSCVNRTPRVLQFALGSNVHSYVLQRGARRALTGMFGLGWCSHDFASIPRPIRISILSNVIKMVNPMNALALLFASERGLETLDRMGETWDIIVRAMIMSVREHVDEVLCKESKACFDSEEWRSVISMDTPVRKDQLELIMMAVLRATKQQQALYITSVYQTFDSLEIPDTPGNFFVKAIIEHIKCELLGNMAPMVSSSAISSLSVSTHFSFVTAREEFSVNASHPELSSSHSVYHRPRTISTASKSKPHSLRTQSSSSSIYSDISNQTVPWSLIDESSPRWFPDGLSSGDRSGSDVEWDDSRSDINHFLALDLADPASMYSRASSRTLSTDYGLFYTRHALSAGSMSTLRRGIRRRNSWDSLTSVH